MFTGIIQKTGRVVLVQVSPERGRLVIRCDPWTRPYEAGESIAVNGVCLTLVDASLGDLKFDVLQETFRLTNLGSRKPGDEVNLERALRHGYAYGGHFVSGHVDGTGRVDAIVPVGRDRRVDISCQPEQVSLLVNKGSICCDGISLTVAYRRPDGFSVHLIPNTLAGTHWHSLQVGDRVNLENDLFAKHVKGLAESGGLPKDFDWSVWRQS